MPLVITVKANQGDGSTYNKHMHISIYIYTYILPSHPEDEGLKIKFPDQPLCFWVQFLYLQLAPSAFNLRISWLIVHVSS